MKNYPEEPYREDYETEEEYEDAVREYEYYTEKAEEYYREQYLRANFPAYRR